MHIDILQYILSIHT